MTEQRFSTTVSATKRRPDLRAARIAELIDLLSAGIKQRPKSGVLPAGWRLEANDGGVDYRRAEVTEGGVTLYPPDGTAVAFAKTAFGLGYTPQQGNNDVVVVNADGTISVQTDGGEIYLFNADGSLKGVSRAADQGAASTAVVPGYNSLGS